MSNEALSLLLYGGACLLYLGWAAWATARDFRAPHHTR